MKDQWMGAGQGHGVSLGVGMIAPMDIKTAGTQSPTPRIDHRRSLDVQPMTSRWAAG